MPKSGERREGTSCVCDMSISSKQNVTCPTCPRASYSCIRARRRCHLPLFRIPTLNGATYFRGKSGTIQTPGRIRRRRDRRLARVVAGPEIMPVRGSPLVTNHITIEYVLFIWRSYTPLSYALYRRKKTIARTYIVFRR